MRSIFLGKGRLIAYGVVVTALLSAAGYISLSQRANAADHSAVGVTGVQHAGLNTSISAFYVDGMYFGKVPRQGGGGSVFCCIGLPKIWRPGLTVDIRWSETDWTNEVVAETDVGNVQSLRSVVYKAIVPVEKYDAIGPVYVHFFDHGRVRVISSLYWPEGPEHPILMVDSTAGKSAIAGTVVPDYFTPAELTEAAAKENIRKKNEVDWR